MHQQKWTTRAKEALLDSETKINQDSPRKRGRDGHLTDRASPWDTWPSAPTCSNRARITDLLGRPPIPHLPLDVCVQIKQGQTPTMRDAQAQQGQSWKRVCVHPPW